MSYLPLQEVTIYSNLPQGSKFMSALSQRCSGLDDKLCGHSTQKSKGKALYHTHTWYKFLCSHESLATAWNLHPISSIMFRTESIKSIFPFVFTVTPNWLQLKPSLFHLHGLNTCDF